MEQYSLLILFLAMIAAWLLTWQPWKRRPSDERSQDIEDRGKDTSDRRR